MTERRVVLLLYILSGACGLVYEVVWMRRLALVFGVSVFATSAVLAVFMAGLGLGSWLVGRRIDRGETPLRIYALLELGIGVYALAVPFIFDGLQPVYARLAGHFEEHIVLLGLARAAVAFAVLIVPTVLMGGTVPAMARYLVAARESVGWNVGLLYALNTAGAVAGCVLAGFVLLPALGMSHTIFIAAGVNIGIGAVLLMSRAGTPPRTASQPSPMTSGDAPNVLVRLAVWTFAISGFTALAYEVAWTRVMVILVHNTTYAFSAMLGVFLAGIALGDLLLVPFYDRIRRPLLWLGVVEMAIGLSVAVAAVSYTRSQFPAQDPKIVRAQERLSAIHRAPAPVAPPKRDFGVGVATWRDAVMLMLRRAGLVLLPGALLFGMTFPLVARVVVVEMGSLGRALGDAYAANTFGAIAGSLAGGFLLIPWCGVRNTLLVLATVNVALGGVCAAAAVRARWRPAVAALALAAAAVPWATVPARIFAEALETGPLRLIYYREGITDTTGVWEGANGSRIVTYGDLRGTAGTETDLANRIQGHLAHLLHPRPTRSLQIGFGVGNTLAAAALHPEVERLDCAELSPHVRETAPYFWTNAHVLENPKVRLIVDDGRNYLLRTSDRYDVITLEPPDIFTAGVVNLYTEDFYRIAARALADDGLFCQWIPYAEMSELDARMLVRAFLEVFPHTTLWEEGRRGPRLVVGTKRPLPIDPAVLARRMARDPVHADLVRLGFAAPEALFGFFVAGTERVRAWVADAPSITDDRTVVDFSTPTRLESGFGFGYFRMRGATLKRLSAEQEALFAAFDRLHEPITPFLVRDGPGG